MESNCVPSWQKTVKKYCKVEDEKDKIWEKQLSSLGNYYHCLKFDSFAM